MAFRILPGEKFIDKDGRGRKKQRRNFKATSNESNKSIKRCPGTGTEEQEASKGVWGMPRLPEITKDVVSCENLRGGANDH